MQIDFIGPRFIKDHKEPLHFLSIRYIRPVKCHIFIRIKSQRTVEVLKVFSKLFFEGDYPIPDVMQMDNDSAFRGYIERKGTIGRVTKWLLHNGAISIFNAQKSPWNNGSVEGGNSVFDRKFWTKFHFTSVKDVDLKLKKFNEEYDVYLRAEKKFPKKSKPIIKPTTFKAKNICSFKQTSFYILRVVRENRYGKCQIEVLNRYITLPSSYRNQYVIAKINVEDQWIEILQERDENLHIIREKNPFQISR